MSILDWLGDIYATEGLIGLRYEYLLDAAHQREVAGRVTPECREKLADVQRRIDQVLLARKIKRDLARAK